MNEALKALPEYEDLCLFPVDAVKKRPFGPWKNLPAAHKPDEYAPVDRGLGLATGSRSGGIIVLDLDKKPGADGVKTVEGWGVTMPRTLTVQTQSGGFHVYFRVDAEMSKSIRNSAGKLGDGVDIRGEGGYVVAPGSPGYTVRVAAPIKRAPAWLLDRLSGSFKEKAPELEGWEAGTYAPLAEEFREILSKVRNGAHRTWLQRLFKGLDPGIPPGERNDRAIRMLCSLAAVRPDLAPNVVGEMLVAGGKQMGDEFSHEDWWADRYRSGAKLVAAERAEAARRQGEGRSWAPLVERNEKTGKLKPTQLNAELILMHEFPNRLRLNVLKNNIELDLPWRSGWQQVRNSEGSPYMHWLYENTTVGFTPKVCMEAILNVGESVEYDPLGDYLKGLEWDGVPRIETWLTEAVGAPDTEVYRLIQKTMLVAAVARGLDPGCKVDQVPVLEGPQGIGKSTLIEVMANGWFKSGLDSTRDAKRACENMGGSWIVELGEVDQWILRESSEHGDGSKGFISATSDKYRASYGRVAQEYPRRVVFWGTTNEKEYLTDRTGNRRWLPIPCATKLDVEALEAVKPQLWAEAVSAYRDGVKTWVDQEITAQEVEKRVYGDSLEREFIAQLGKDFPEGLFFLQDIYDAMPLRLRMDYTKFRRLIGRRQKALGFANARTNKRRGWKFVGNKHYPTPQALLDYYAEYHDVVDTSNDGD